MRKRDFLILILCGIGLFVMLQQEGTVSLEKAFVLPTKQPTNMVDAINHELAEHDIVETLDDQSSEQYIDYGYV